MAPLADFLVAHLPISLPTHLTSYVPGKTPLSTTPAVLGTLVAYLAVIFGIKALMTDRQPHRLNALFQTHNVILSSGSLLLLVLMLEEILPIMWTGGVFHALCATEAWTPRMEFYYMINYYFKYLELLDTVFLALKKKPMPYSHMVVKYYANALPNVGDCAGSEGAAIFGCALLTSYLGLFINFYFQTYKKPSSKPKANGVAKGKSNGHKAE
ncbi:hypothetical protein DXG03_007024 [Asterophora parasitica]|uniref:Elongation of fatty acids protein n=1 Tax=Asterophora parasitica TaxID=117018 RepID=A0A9P7GET9_9AGAR|nr:hypothetical protein DXG03_007024 [Asterophora parasitica]